MKSRATDLLERLESIPYPSGLLTDVGHFELWTDYVSGYLMRLSKGDQLDEDAKPIMEDGADKGTRGLVDRLASKRDLSPEERVFMDYWSVLEEARLLILKAAGDQKRRG